MVTVMGRMRTRVVQMRRKESQHWQSLAVMMRSQMAMLMLRGGREVPFPTPFY